MRNNKTVSLLRENQAVYGIDKGGIITAKILDSTHLELTRPISFTRGKTIRISIPGSNEEDNIWRVASAKHFLEAYSEKDSIYDKL